MIFFSVWVPTGNLSVEGTCRAGSGRHQKSPKIARQRQKNKTFEKNETYMKEHTVLSMPANFFDDRTKIGDRMASEAKHGN